MLGNNSITDLREVTRPISANNYITFFNDKESHKGLATMWEHKLVLHKCRIK